MLKASSGSFGHWNMKTCCREKERERGREGERGRERERVEREQVVKTRTVAQGGSIYKLPKT